MAREFQHSPRFLRVLIVSAMSALGLGGSAAATIFQRVALLTGDQEVPPNASTAVGSARFEVDTCANTLRYRIAYSCLTSAETAAHIHGPAGPGVNAGVVHPLPAGNPKVGVWNYPEAAEADILSGRMYVNIHTTMFPGGEIRGQIVTHVAYIDGAQETPPATIPGRGYGLFMVDTAADTMNFYIQFAGLSAAETAAHIHGFVPHGVAAGVVFPLPLGNPKVGVWNYPAANEGQILDGLSYVNIHTTAFPGGELRGQITSYVVPIDPLQEVPPSPTTGSGRGLLALDRAGDRLSYDIAHCGLSTPETAAHFHGFAAPGVNAGVINPLAVGPRKLGTWVYPAASEPNIVAGLTYINIHTTAFAGGEIRGQCFFLPIGAPCPGDFDGNGVRDINDLGILLSNFGLPGNNCTGDMDGNGIVDLTDLAAFLALYGIPC
jgi:hypothetical protein